MQVMYHTSVEIVEGDYDVLIPCLVVVDLFGVGFHQPPSLWGFPFSLPSVYSTFIFSGVVSGASGW